MNRRSFKILLLTMFFGFIAGFLFISSKVHSGIVQTTGGFNRGSGGTPRPARDLTPLSTVRIAQSPCLNPIKVSKVFNPNRGFDDSRCNDPNYTCIPEFLENGTIHYWILSINQGENCKCTAEHTCASSQFCAEGVPIARIPATPWDANPTCSSGNCHCQPLRAEGQSCITNGTCQNDNATTGTRDNSNNEMACLNQTCRKQQGKRTSLPCEEENQDVYFCDKNNAGWSPGHCEDKPFVCIDESNPWARGDELCLAGTNVRNRPPALTLQEIGCAIEETVDDAADWIRNNPPPQPRLP